MSTVTPLTSGVHGGAILTVEGNGFSSNRSQVHITVGSSPCPVVEATESRVRCRIPPQTNNPNIQINSHQVSFPSTFVLNYTASITPNVSSVTPNLGSGLQTLTITGENLVGPGQTEITLGETPCNISSRATRSISCTVSPDLPAGNHSVRVNVEEVGDGNENVIYRHDLTVTGVTPPEGGYGGGLSGVILGNGFNRTGVSVSVCNRSCASLEVISNGQLICETPSMPMSSTNTLCNMTVEVEGIKKNTPFTYKANLTSTITSVGPNRGGTGGGTTITINGTNFP